MSYHAFFIACIILFGAVKKCQIIRQRLTYALLVEGLELNNIRTLCKDWQRRRDLVEQCKYSYRNLIFVGNRFMIISLPLMGIVIGLKLWPDHVACC
jgi:hypothetical protein